MRKKIIIALSATVFFCVMAGGAWLYLQANSGYAVDVYRFNSRTNQLEAERRMIPYNSPEEMVRSVIDVLRSAPRNNNLRQTIPADLRIDEVRIRWDGVMEIDFPAEYRNMPPYQEGLFRASLVQTMTQLPFINIEGLLVLVEGESLSNAFGEWEGILTGENVLVNPDIRPRMMTTRNLTLYFVNEDIDGLLSEERSREVPTFAVESAIIEELIAGPKQEGRQSAIPPDTQIISVRTGGGICSINLSTEFVTGFSGTQSLAELTLQSIIRSIMVNESHINSIQFLIDSQYRESFNGVPYFDALFHREEIERDEAG